MRTITCRVCGEYRRGVRVRVSCFKELNEKLGDHWLKSEWFRALEQFQWRENKRWVVQQRVAEEIASGVAVRRQSRFEAAVDLLHRGYAVDEVTHQLAGGTATVDQRKKAGQAVKRAVEFLGPAYRPELDEELAED